MYFKNKQKTVTLLVILTMSTKEFDRTILARVWQNCPCQTLQLYFRRLIQKTVNTVDNSRCAENIIHQTTRIAHVKLCSFILEDQNKTTVNTVDNTGFQKLFWPKYLFALHLRIKNIKRIPIKNYTHVIKLLSFAIVIIPV